MNLKLFFEYDYLKFLIEMAKKRSTKNIQDTQRKKMKISEHILNHKNSQKYRINKIMCVKL